MMTVGKRAQHKKLLIAAALLAAFAAGVVLGRALPDAPEGRQLVAAADPATATPATTPAPWEAVYISSSGVMHADPHCSGMTSYTTRERWEAEQEGIRKCSKCWRDSK